MELKLNTLLQVLFANDQEALIAVATRIDAGIELEYPTEISVNIDKSQLAPGWRVKGDRNAYNITIKCPVIVINKYKLKGMYTVQLPNGQLKNNCEPSTNSLAELELIPSVTETPVTIDHEV